MLVPLYQATWHHIPEDRFSWSSTCGPNIPYAHYCITFLVLKTFALCQDSYLSIVTGLWTGWLDWFLAGKRDFHLFEASRLPVGFTQTRQCHLLRACRLALKSTGTRDCHLLRVFWLVLGYAGIGKYDSFRAFWLVLESAGTRDFQIFRASALALGSI